MLPSEPGLLRPGTCAFVSASATGWPTTLVAGAVNVAVGDTRVVVDGTASSPLLALPQQVTAPAALRAHV